MQKIIKRIVGSQRVFIRMMLLCIIAGTGLMATDLMAAAPDDSPSRMLPDSLILLPEAASALLVEKCTQRIFLYTCNENECLQKMEFPCSTGEVAGRKLQSGDKKTPEGVYFFIDEHEDRDLAPVYGKKAFPTDYPNLLDRLAGRNGSAIWLHGTNRKLVPMDSNGCVAMNNEDILSLDSYITLEATPVIICESITYSDRQTIDQMRQDITSVMKQWAGAMEAGNYHDYLGFYDNNYLPEISWWTDWIQVRNAWKQKEGGFSVTTDIRGIYKEKDTVVVPFVLGLSLSGKHRDAGLRQLFFQENNGRFLIVGDTYRQIPPGVSDNETPLVKIASVLSGELELSGSVLAMVENWLQAWSSKDMKTYAKSYAEDFYSDGMDRSAWLERKEMLARKYRDISVSGTNFQVEQGDRDSVVTFFQDYRSNKFTALGVKTLKLRKEEGEWKIYQESWKMK